MPNLTATEITKAIAKTKGKFSEPEFREGAQATARLMFANESTVFKNVKTLKASVLQPTEAILMARKSQAIGANKEANHTAAEFEDSFVQPITYLQAQRKFKVSYKLAENNLFGYQDQMDAGILNAFMDIRGAINTYGIAQLAAGKNQVAVSAPLMAWDGVAFDYTNLAINVEKMASYLKSVMRFNNYLGQVIQIVGGQRLVADLLHYSKQAAGNSENFAYQFENLEVVEEAGIDETAIGSANGYGYAFGRGYVGMTSWNEGKNKNPDGLNDPDGTSGYFTTIPDPIIPGLLYDVHVKRKLADTDLGGGKVFYQDTVDEFEVTAFYAFGQAQMSTANQSPSFAISQA